MLAEPINVKRQDVAQIVNATFADYRGRKIRLVAREKVTISGLNWDGGSRSQYRTCTLEGRYIGGADRFNAMAPWDAGQVHSQSVTIPSGACIVEHSIFCGKDTGLRIYVNPADMPKLLPSP